MLYVDAEVVSCHLIQNRDLTDASCRSFHRRMSDLVIEIRLSKLLLEAEVAALLRRSCSHVKRLRLERKLGYLRSRPVTIDEKDLEIYVARAKQRRVLRTEALKTRRANRAKGQSEAFGYVSAGATPRPFKLLTVAEAATKFEQTPRQVRYLCLQGRVPYIVGRPPLIDEKDIAEHFERKRAAALAKIPPAPGTPEFKVLEDQESEARMFHRLRVKAIKRKVARILAERAARRLT
jgi:hypothetical protein